MALAERGFIEGAEIDAILEAFVLKLDIECTMRRQNHTRSEDCRRKGDTNKKKDNHNNGRKKTRHALQNELYKKCLKKLVEIMDTNGNEETRVEFPYASEVETVYRELWDRKGHENVTLDKRCRSERIEVEQIWSPITMDEITQKFKKIKADTAPGVDQSPPQKESVAGVSEILQPANVK